MCVCVCVCVHACVCVDMRVLMHALYLCGFLCGFLCEFLWGDLVQILAHLLDVIQDRICLLDNNNNNNTTQSTQTQLKNSNAFKATFVLCVNVEKCIDANSTKPTTSLD